MAQITYQEILNMAAQLDPEEQLRLLEKLAANIRQKSGIGPSRSILDLLGLGRNIWRGLDSMQYIREERESWDG